ncbi:TetR/AcrR family transcriptional regulator [Agromyces mediolanus]|uniref:TetR/AcrR family transcriptional regulator n=1 Tax=Agromyces mediolanus TaxID=41986 RepID=UPI003836120E
MPEPSARRAGRPRTRVLSAEHIVDAAFELARTAGPDGFTMAALARSLSVHPPALYHYFAGKADVVRAMRGALAEQLDVSGFADETVPLEEAVSRWAHSYRDVTAAHPAGIELLATTPIDGQERSVQNYDTIVRRFIAEGCPDDEAVDALVTFEALIIGSALDAAAPDDIMAPGDAGAGAPAFTAAEAARTERAAARGIRPTDASFALGIRALLAGLRTGWTRG